MPDSSLLPIVDDLVSNPEKQSVESPVCDEAFGLYLLDVAGKVSQTGYSLVGLFVEKLRACLNDQNSNPLYTHSTTSTHLPDCANHFITEYLTGEDLSREDAIELMMHFCRWLFVKQYSHLKLSLCE